MGSMISLGVGRMEIDWGKNNFFRNHSALFQTSDVKMIPYYYVDNDGNPLVVEQEGYSRKLKAVKPRLDLLGYTLDIIEEKYNQLRNDFLCHGFEKILSYEAFSKLLKEIDVNRINTPELAVEYDEYGYDLGEFVRRCIIPEKEIYQRLLDAVDGDESQFRFGIEEFFENKANINLNDRKLQLFINGVQLSYSLQDGIYRIYNEKNNFIGIGLVKNNLLKREIIVENVL